MFFSIIYTRVMGVSVKKEVLEKGNKTKEGRLKIKEIKKYNTESKIYHSLLIIQGIITGSFSLIGVCIFIQGLREKYIGNSIMLTYLIGIISFLIAFLSTLDMPEIREERDKYRDMVISLEEQILNPKEERMVK